MKAVKYHLPMATLHSVTGKLIIVILAFGTFVLAAIKVEAEHLAKLGNHTLMGIVIQRA
tara:strand:+ start:54 stop:230 length:177 start_codon:yes stop_codon:yes gene_type:complete